MEAPRPPEQKKVFLDSERNTVFVGAADGSGQLPDPDRGLRTAREVG
jgi:hypothetical protein